MTRPSGYASTVAALALTQTVSWAILYYGFSALVLPMQRSLGWSEPRLMGALTLSLAIWALCSYAAGAAIDRGRGRSVMTLGTAIGALACAGWALATAPWMLYAACMAVGAAAALSLYEPVFSVLTKKYPLHYRQAITAVTLVAGFASTVSFPAFAALDAAIGWRGALWVAVGALAFFVLPVQWWALRGPALGDAPAAGPGADLAADHTLHEALRHRAFWLLGLSFTLMSLASAALWAHVMPVLASKGLGTAAATAVVVWIGPAQVAGRFVFAALGRNLTLRQLGLWVVVCMPVALLLLAQAQGLPGLLVFAFLFGLANGLITIVRGGLLPEYFGRAHVGRIAGAIAAMTLVARAGAPLLLAWLLVGAGGYSAALWVLAVLGLVGAVAFAAAGAPGSPDSKPVN